MWIGDKSSGIKKSNRVYSINLSFTVEMVRNVLNINKKSVIEFFTDSELLFYS